MTANDPPDAQGVGHIDDWYEVPEGDTLDDDTIVDYLAQMNNREDPEEGIVPHRVRRFARFQRQIVALSWFRPQEWEEGFSPSMAQTYSKDPAANAPPIVVDGVDRAIIDGFHRLNAARIRGDTHILAYVGIEPRAEWEPFDEDDDSPVSSGRAGPR